MKKQQLKSISNCILSLFLLGIIVNCFSALSYQKAHNQTSISKIDEHHFNIPSNYDSFLEDDYLEYEDEFDQLALSHTKLFLKNDSKLMDIEKSSTSTKFRFWNRKIKIYIKNCVFII